MVKEECGIFGAFGKNPEVDAARLTYYGLYALQHRGQESCGIAAMDNGTVIYHKDTGLVPDVFDEVMLEHLSGGCMGVGHVRYATAGSIHRENAQPLVSKYVEGTLTLAHNGSVVNAAELREKLEKKGAIFQTASDSEVISYLIAHERLRVDSVEEAVISAMKRIRGAYSLVIMSLGKLIAVRDPDGFRPLSIGKTEDAILVASETCAFDSVDGEFIRDVAPGEVVVISSKGIRSINTNCAKDSSICIFEYIYFARPDSVIEDISVYDARKRAGRELAKQYPVEADIVIGVPDSGTSAAIGYSEQSGIPYSTGLIKNRYIGRTFIKPTQKGRVQAVKIKLNALSSAVRGKRVIMVDDSIVRGTTCRHIIKMLKDAGASEVHVRVSSPPFMYPCYFGTDIPDKKELAACNYRVEALAAHFEADSLEFLSIESLSEIIRGKKGGFCAGCFTGAYPIDMKKASEKLTFERSIVSE